MTARYKIKKYLFLLTMFLFSINTTSAATFSIHPESKQENVGDIFSVKVKANSSGEIMNAFSVKLSFDPSILEVYSISKSNSIINFWATEPVWSNETGVFSLEGLVLNGYYGSMGEIVSINFKAKDVGYSEIAFSSPEILANDGLGTSIISGSFDGSVEVLDHIERDNIVEEEFWGPIKESLDGSEASPGVKRVYSREDITINVPFNNLIVYFIVLSLLFVGLVVKHIILLEGHKVNKNSGNKDKLKKQEEDLKKQIDKISKLDKTVDDLNKKIKKRLEDVLEDLPKK